MEIVLIILAVSVPLTALAVAAAFWFMSRQQERHLVLVLDKFLSRNLEEYNMTDLTRREIIADQQEDNPGDEDDEEKVFEKFLADRRAATEMLEVNS